MKISRWSIFLTALCFSLLANEKATPGFDLASLERQMWQAYYDKTLQTVSRLAEEYLVQLFSLSPDQAREAAPLFLKPMETFSSLPNNMSDVEYEVRILPELEILYVKLSDMTTKFDGKAAAKAELTWWIARRRATSRNTENVGRLMAQALAIMLGGQASQYERMAYLRAEAGCFRDKCQNDWGGVLSNDWMVLENLLRLSYDACPYLKVKQCRPPSQSPTDASQND